MGKSKRKKGRKSAPINQRRPKQIIALLAFLGLKVLLALYRWLFYITQNVVYDSSLGVSPEYFAIYRKGLLIVAFVELALWLLLFFRTKVGYCIAAVFYISIALVTLFYTFIALAIRFFSPLLYVLISVLYLYFLFCKPSRSYFWSGERKKGKKSNEGKKGNKSIK